MATTKKALAMADELASELKQRQGALAISQSFDTDGNPLVKIGTGAIGAKGGLVKFMPIDWPLAKDILGLASQVYTPHKALICVEANNAAGAGADVNTWNELLLIVATVVNKGTRVEMYQSPNGNAVDATDFVPGNLVATFEPSQQYGMLQGQ